MFNHIEIYGSDNTGVNSDLIQSTFEVTVRYSIATTFPALTRRLGHSRRSTARPELPPVQRKDL